MKMTVIASIFALAVFVEQASAAEGQLSFYAGYLNPGNLSLNNVQAGPLNFRGTGLYGARAEFDFLKFLGIEENVGFSPKLFSSGLLPQQASDVRGFLYIINLMLNIPLGRLVPYLTGGVGFIKPWGTSFMPFDNTFAGNFGGGVKMDRLIGPIGLRFDVRGWRTADIAGRGGLNLLDASGGVTFSWGRR